MRMAKKKDVNLDRAKQAILGGLNEAQSLRGISMRHALVETGKGVLEGEPAAKNMKQMMLDAIADAESVFAVLTEVGVGEASWKIKRTCAVNAVEVIQVRSYGPYEAADQDEFHRWSRLALKTLQDSNRNPKQLRIPGKLCFSANGKVVFGWEEDAEHPDAMLLAVGEVMST